MGHSFLTGTVSIWGLAFASSQLGLLEFRLLMLFTPLAQYSNKGSGLAILLACVFLALFQVLVVTSVFESWLSRRQRNIKLGLTGLGLWVFGILCGAAFLLLSSSNRPPFVVIYAAQDQVYAEPILREFETKTGIKVKAVYDSEAVKTVAIVNRLLAERSHPQCDVFWGNEEMRTRQLATQNVFRETNGWAAFGYRSRRIVVNTQFPSGRRLEDPSSLLELTNEIWRGKIALAFPQFGTTATHFHALKQLWGEERWLAWCRAFAANKPFIVDGNSVVVKMVARGEAWVGLTDSDDIAAGQREGQPISALPLTGESLLIPNTVAVIRDAPHPASAQRLFEYLQRREVAEKLVQANALESVTDGTDGATLKPDWNVLLRDLETTTKHLNEIFLR